MKKMVIGLMTEIEKEYGVFGYNLQNEENLKKFNKDCFGTMTSTVIKFYLNYKGVLYFYFADEGIFSCDKEDIRFEGFDKSVWKDSRLYLIEYDDE